MPVIHPFEPVFDATSRVLILGSFPSVKSRDNHFYYGHPQNRFWKLMARLLSSPVPQDIPHKRELLLTNHIALWDVLASCDIVGSADVTIKNPKPNDIGRILARSQVEAVFCNGAKSHQLFGRLVAPKLGVSAGVLPSTSPANAQYSLDRLEAVWREMLQPYLPV